LRRVILFILGSPRRGEKEKGLTRKTFHETEGRLPLEEAVKLSTFAQEMTPGGVEANIRGETAFHSG